MSWAEPGWHLATEDLDRYVDGRASTALEASVDAHLLRCPACRATVTHIADARRPDRIEARWASIADVIDRPRPSILEMLLTGLGLTDVHARALVATPRLFTAWLATIALTVATALFAGRTGTGRIEITCFLLIAPLLPMIGTALAYSPRAEPPGHLAVATPGRGHRLLLSRAAFVLATSIPILLVGGLLLPGPAAAGVAWVLPALGLTTATLALTPFVDALRAATALSIAWLVAVAWSAVAAGRGPIDDFARQLLPLQSFTQLAFVAVLVVTGAAIALHTRPLLTQGT
jgi:hypothetical protein